MATRVHEAAWKSIAEERQREIGRLRTLLHKLVRKGADGHWYTSQHGDTDVTYFVGHADLNATD